MLASFHLALCQTLLLLSSLEAMSLTEPIEMSHQRSLATELFQANKRKTRLRAGTPQGEFRRSTYTRLYKVFVSVRNAGSVQAENVRVYIETPMGNRVKLYGSSSLAPGVEETYSATPNEIVTTTKKMRVVDLGCDNCYR